jgi:hypothetical protein
MEPIAAIVAAILGWKYRTLGAQEAKAIAIVVLGWTTVTTAASLPYFSPGGLLYVLVFRTLVVGGAYAAGALLGRLSARWRRR